jgi:predicted esterase YcpF (UPF0227 family)
MDQARNRHLGKAIFWMTLNWTSLVRGVAMMLLALFVLPTMAEKPNLNPEYGDAAYRPFSVFSPDAATSADYKPNVMVVFHGFMSAVPNGTFKRVRKSLLKTHTTLGINYNPLDVPGTQAFLRDVALEHLQGRNVTVLGTSLGGFWARYFGHIIGAQKVVMLNPIVRPYEQLNKYVDTTRSNRRRIQDFSITALALAPYSGIDVARMSGPVSLLIVTRDDERQSPDIALSAYQNAPSMTVQIYAAGGHTINLKKHEALARIAQFVRGQ